MGAVRSLAFSSDGGRLVTVGGYRKLVVWDIASGKAIYSTHFPDGVSLAAGFALDDRHIVTSNPDGTMYILRLPQQPERLERDSRRWDARRVEIGFGCSHPSAHVPIEQCASLIQQRVSPTNRRVPLAREANHRTQAKALSAHN
jgi:hypothetical protein